MTASTDATTTHDLSLVCRGISQRFGAKSVLHEVNLEVWRGQFVSLVGPSGCGKSTLFRAIVGTHPPQRGEVLVHTAASGGQLAPVIGPGRERGIVYQHYSLFPFLTAQENAALGLMLGQTSIPFRALRFFKWRQLRKQHLEQAAEFLKKVKLGDAIHLYPHEMSGGMKQRVAIAQALIMKPEIILLDEPFGALDESTREELQEMLLDLHEENQAARKRGEKPPYTLIIVTHELNEAIYVGDRLVGLSQYWNWRGAGHEACPGAMIIYDKPTTGSTMRGQRDFEAFTRQRDEIRSVVFDPRIPSDPHEHVTRYPADATKP